MNRPYRSWLRSLKARLAGTPARTPIRNLSWLRVEHLEDRTTPSTITRVSVDAAGAQGVGGAGASELDITPDGRYVVFASAFNLAPGSQPAGLRQVFRKDLQSGAVVRVSSTAMGAAGTNGTSNDPTISADGRYVAFESTCPDLVPGDTNNSTDVFVKDLQTGAITRVSTSSSGAQASGFDAVISANGTYEAASCGAAGG